MLIRLLQRHLKENKYELKHEQEKNTEKELTKNKRRQDVEEGNLPRPKVSLFIIRLNLKEFNIELFLTTDH